MTTAGAAGHPGAVGVTRYAATDATSTETRPSYRTTEFFAYIAAAAAIVLTALVVGDDGAGADPFGADQAIRYLTFLTIGYMVSRGLAKAGCRDSRAADR
ncbi:hypothetical protein ACVGVM_08065 [Pseudonocardia bannensis]|uniref:Uncharacterized protein n=1 Tax=Pseudonocardia bannensis TaxID=630973 RepID=A0A848DCT7_9PSEU|nr:hypothetical protein [Pseudonocardia bannensis]NMH90410.1 hypothetical protein [Pseudonocardia bannensis]